MAKGSVIVYSDILAVFLQVGRRQPSKSLTLTFRKFGTSQCSVPYPASLDPSVCETQMQTCFVLDVSVRLHANHHHLLISGCVEDVAR